MLRCNKEEITVENLPEIIQFAGTGNVGNLIKWIDQKDVPESGNWA